MLPTINSSRNNRLPNHPHHPTHRKPSASEVLSLVAAKYAELFHYLHTVPPPAPASSTSSSSPPLSSTLSSSTPNISSAISQTNNDDHKINGSNQPFLLAAHHADQTQVLLTPHELAAIHHAAAWSLAQQPHLLLEERQRRRSGEKSSDRFSNDRSYPRKPDEKASDDDLAHGEERTGKDDGGRESSQLPRLGSGGLDDGSTPSSSSADSTGATSYNPPPRDPHRHATADAAEPESRDHEVDDEAPKHNIVANPEAEDAEADARIAREDHDQRDYNQAFTGVLERSRIDYLALKDLVRMYLRAWKGKKKKKSEGEGEEGRMMFTEEMAEEDEEPDEEREDRWRSAAEKKAAIELACRRYAQTFEGELRERRERDSSSLVMMRENQRSSDPSHLRQQWPRANPLLQHLQKQRLPLGASQQVSRNERGERRREEEVEGWAERWVRPVVRWRDEGKRVLPAGREDEAEKVDWKSILAHGTGEVKEVIREGNQNLRALAHQPLKRAVGNGCPDARVEETGRSFDGDGVVHGDGTSIPRTGGKRKRHVSLHALNELGSAEFNNGRDFLATTPLPTLLPPPTPWTASGHETCDRMWSQCQDRINGVEPRPHSYGSELPSFSLNHQSTVHSERHSPLHPPNDLTRHQVRAWYTRWQELRHSAYRRNDHDEREFQRLSALLAEARPLIAQWKREEAAVWERDPRVRRGEDRLDVWTNAWTMSMEQDTIGFGSRVQLSQPSRLLCEPLFSQGREGNFISPSLAPLSSAFGQAPAQRQQRPPPPPPPPPPTQQQLHHSFSSSFAMPVTQYHQEHPDQRIDPQQHKRIDSHETLTNDAFPHTNRFPMTPSQQILHTTLQPTAYSSMSRPTPDASQRWDIYPLSTATTTTASSDWSSGGQLRGELFGNSNGNPASLGAEGYGEQQRNETAFLPSSSAFSSSAAGITTPTPTPNDFSGAMDLDLPRAGLSEDYHVNEPFCTDGQRQQNSTPLSTAENTSDPLNFSRDDGWDDERFSAAFGQDTWMEDWAEAAGGNHNGFV
ncbi:hypothetical protein KC316_g11968 [Hortaea werneckii]|nr:hypothetical protein KC324_g11828 [Hortaea werneckii]KAI7572029.1 hypothetical protein KC316_g11968 [Hortaea werneckii]